MTSFTKEHNLDLLVHTNQQGVADNINPFEHGSNKYTQIMKTQALLQALAAGGYDAAFGGARRDEEKSRAKERIYSFRDRYGQWDPKNQRPELWNLYNGKLTKGESIRAFPLSNWTELDIWLYIYLEKIQIVPLYFAAERPVVERNGHAADGRRRPHPAESRRKTAHGDRYVSHLGLLPADRRAQVARHHAARNHQGNAAHQVLRAPRPPHRLRRRRLDGNQKARRLLLMGLSATSATSYRQSSEISQGDREIGSRASENFGLTRRPVIFGTTQPSLDRLARVAGEKSWEVSEQVIGACIEVHRLLGPGLLESVYEAALCEELTIRQLPFKRQSVLPVEYKGRLLEQSYRADLIVAEQLLIEVKSVEALLFVHVAQARHLSPNHEFAGWSDREFQHGPFARRAASCVSQQQKLARLPISRSPCEISARQKLAVVMSEQELISKDILGYLDQHQKKELLRFVSVGSVDDGKSTLIGRLLHDTHGIYEDQLSAVKRASGRAGMEIDFSLFTDGLKAEREQGITIDVAYRYFSTAKRKFIIADTPGHVQYTRNMATGASTANVAIILIDARLGVLQQSRRHAYIASLLGIPHLAVCINKMDLVGYEQATFEAIKRNSARFARS